MLIPKLSSVFSRRCLCICFAAFPLITSIEASAQQGGLLWSDSDSTNDEKSEDEKDKHSTLHIIACYLPNRVLDLLDIFRARIRVGPGFGVGVRATEVASAYVGSYATVYAGLPGPRGRSFPKSPVGLESHTGVTVSVVDATVDGGIGPDYSPTEFGVGGQLGIIGADIGFDPMELLDFGLGIFTVDVQKDDF